MKVEHFLGTDECADKSGIKDILSKQNSDGFNEFWISTEKPFPFMAALTKGKLAYVHFFPEDGHPGFRGLAAEGDNDLSEDDVTVFMSNNCSEKMWIENCCVIPLEKTVNVIEQFFETDKLRGMIEWDEL